MAEFEKIKNWNVDVESKITRGWKDAELYRVDAKTKKPIYSIDTPPPYVNYPIHIAQAVTYCYMDFFARYKRMKGFDVVFPLGLDRNGLPIELAAEKQFKVSPFKIGREAFVAKCEKLINEGSVDTTESFAQLGISFTSYLEGDHIGAVYKTDSPEYRALTQSTFVELYRKGIVYEDSRINNWDPKLRTTVADSEIERAEKETDLNFVKFKLVDSNETVTIATTRPELLCTSALIIYNPKDDRYKKLKGKKAITPLFGNEVEIIEHSDADPEFGTGLVFMSSSGGDQEAVRFLRKVGIKPVSAVDMQGKLNHNGGFLEGLKTRDARAEVIKRLSEEGHMEKQEKLMHSVPVSERSKAEIEFVEMKEFYLAQMDKKRELRKVIDKIAFYPAESKKILESWIANIAIDWPISRRRYYATPIPLWYSGNKVAVPPKGVYVEPYKDAPGKDFEVLDAKTKKSLGTVKDFKAEKWVGEERVFDTWMDSSISELVLLKYQVDDAFFKKAYPASLRPQGKEIVRTWLYYTILRGYLETKQPCFEAAWIHQHLTDATGRKMSKSLGNVIDPRDLVKEYGAEAIRMWAATEGNLARNDLKVSRERIAAETKTLNKILNVARFVNLFEKPKRKPKQLAALDRLMLDHMEALTKQTDESYGVYDFYTPMIELREFIWNTFASHYLEIVKPRAYNQDKQFSDSDSASARYVLHELLERFLHLVFPVIPQVTSVIATAKGIDLLRVSFPAYDAKAKDSAVVADFKEFNSAVWKAKKEQGISLRNPIADIKIPKNLASFAADLKMAHHLE